MCPGPLWRWVDGIWNRSFARGIAKQHQTQVGFRHLHETLNNLMANLWSNHQHVCAMQVKTHYPVCQSSSNQFFNTAGLITLSPKWFMAKSMWHLGCWRLGLRWPCCSSRQYFSFNCEVRFLCSKLFLCPGYFSSELCSQNDLSSFNHEEISLRKKTFFYSSGEVEFSL